MANDKVIAIALGVFFVALIWAQFFLTHDIRHDHQVIRDLQAIENQVIEAAYGGGRFDVSRLEFDFPGLSDLELEPKLDRKVERGDYELRYIDIDSNPIRFELCGNFKTDTTSGSYAEESY